MDDKHVEPWMENLAAAVRAGLYKVEDVGTTPLASLLTVDEEEDEEPRLIDIPRMRKTGYLPSPRLETARFIPGLQTLAGELLLARIRLQWMDTLPTPVDGERWAVADFMASPQVITLAGGLNEKRAQASADIRVILAHMIGCCARRTTDHEEATRWRLSVFGPLRGDDFETMQALAEADRRDEGR